MWIARFFQFFISLIMMKFEIIELFFQWYITPTENLNNFKRNLKIREPSTEELGNLVKYEIIY